jgi:phosphate transport system substrate-binding protein
MRTTLRVLLPAAALALCLSGCGGTDRDGGTVNLDGSSSMERVVKVLMESFRADFPEITVNYNASGSGAGITAALEGTVDLGLSSRALGAEELEAGATAHVVALDGVAVIVHPDNPLSDLSRAELAALFTGEISNWSQLGGGDAPVAALGREPGSGTRGAFEESLGITDSCVYAAEYSSSGDILGNVAANPNAIGYVSLSGVSDAVKALQVDGVACTEETVRDGSFPLQRPFLLVTRADAPLSAAAQAFLDYALSDRAAALIALAGAVAPGGA